MSIVHLTYSGEFVTRCLLGVCFYIQIYILSMYFYFIALILVRFKTRKYRQILWNTPRENRWESRCIDQSLPMQIHYANSSLLNRLHVKVNYRQERQIAYSNGVHININLSDHICLTRYCLNSSMGWTSPYGQKSVGQICWTRRLFVNGNT